MGGTGPSSRIGDPGGDASLPNDALLPCLDRLPTSDARGGARLESLPWLGRVAEGERPSRVLVRWGVIVPPVRTATGFTVFLCRAGRVLAGSSPLRTSFLTAVAAAAGVPSPGRSTTGRVLGTTTFESISDFHLMASSNDDGRSKSTNTSAHVASV